MPRSLLNIPGKDCKQRIWVAQFENGGCVLMLPDLANAVPQMLLRSYSLALVNYYH